MKKILRSWLCAACFIPAGLATVHAAEDWKPVSDPGKIVPAAGEYAILISEATAKDAGWAKIAATLQKRYKGKILTWKENVTELEAALKDAHPRYIAVVAKPQEIDRVVVADLHGMARRIDPDFYGDAIFGIITARSPKQAELLVEAQKAPLLLERGVSTTNCDLERFKRHFFVTDWEANQYVETRNGVSSEKKFLPEGKEIVELFAKKFDEINPQYLISASHATEFNLEMPYSRGLIAPAKGKFYCFKTAQIRDFLRRMGEPEKVESYAKEHKLLSIKPNNDPKIWIASGNCLFGDILRSPDSVAATLLSEYGVRQLVGYTVPTWYGVGWDVHGNFFNGHQDVTVGQAWYFTNQRNLERLPDVLRSHKLPLRAKDMSGVDMNVAHRALYETKAEVTRDNLGRFHDRDVIAFYGDPLFRSAFDQNAKNCQPWHYTLETKGKERRLTVKGTQGKTRKSEFRFWFPELRNTDEPIRFTRVKGNAREAVDVEHSSTKNFLMLSEQMELAPDERLVIEYSVR